MSTGRPVVNLTSLSIPLAAENHAPAGVNKLPLPGLGWHIHHLLTVHEVQALALHARMHCSVEVGIDGIRDHYQEGARVGSFRASAFSQELADRLWARLAALPWPATFSAASFTDWAQVPHWSACGINPLFRFIRYRPGQGELVAHYDAPYVQDPDHRTLYTLLLYLTSNEEEGATRFVLDSQDEVPLENRDFSDWPRCAHDCEVRLSVSPIAGDALVFEHRLLHDSSPVTRSEKLVVRSDICFHALRSAL